ncbi:MULTISPECIES: hypothetical protein [unclassified Rhizobacter]|uniref:hypothetical protein n=1 Tax=unclassified Rhizobacter TaxID=2640088 RepID=UPI0006F9441E|nr:MULTISPECIES: hypothetical protein [unclassified Rhizobacter]KQU75594.1 hypothetical protein ASC88_24850 [Rhizobacter sp. Root29]KQW06825.1 hypothetical protein ASC98_25610 [Rhizobacter sp. Root1238]KRB19053.1 hypothetical protein ASE08_07585 [Rhizobacter sp. Root16D2]
MNTTIRPFRIEIAQAQIVELQRRLAATRWPQPVDPGFGRGQSLALALVRGLAPSQVAAELEFTDQAHLTH